MKEVYTPIAKIYFDEKISLLHKEIKNEAVMKIDLLRKHYEIIHGLTKGRKYLALIDAQNPFYIFYDGFEYLASPTALENVIAVAYFNPSLSNRLSIMNMRQRISDTPIEVFTSKQDAMEWLLNFKN